MEKLFKLKENGTNISTEIAAGITTFFAMAYIIVVNPSILSQTGMEWGAVFIATIIASIVGTLIMGLFANVPYAQAPGMGLNAFFTYTVCFGLGFTWQQALCMVFICGLVNILITVTKIRKIIIRSIPTSLQNAISGGIGIFIAYVGLLNVGIISFTPNETAPALAVPGMAVFSSPVLWVFLIGLLMVVVLNVKKIRGAMLIAIVVTAVIGIPFGVTKLSDSVGISEIFAALPSTFGVIFTSEGLPSLFSDASKIPLVLITIFSFSMSNMFDTIGTFIGTGRRTGIFSEEDEKALGNGSGIKSKMDKALFADAVATATGAVIGTSNITTYVESAAGIAAGGRTGLTSVVVSICFGISIFLSPVISAIPSAATAPVLLIVGCMMLASFAEIKWTDLSEAIPAFFAAIFMALCYSISYGIAAGFIMFCIVKVCKKQTKEIHPVIGVVTLLFILNFVLRAFI